jgi:imidazole glycerol phosphate synthase subunit HisF
VHIPIVAGNGIRTKEDMRRLKLVGADGIFIGSRAVVRPYGMKADNDYGAFIFGKP